MTSFAKPGVEFSSNFIFCSFELQPIESIIAAEATWRQRAGQVGPGALPRAVYVDERRRVDADELAAEYRMSVRIV